MMTDDPHRKLAPVFSKPMKTETRVKIVFFNSRDNGKRLQHRTTDPRYHCDPTDRPDAVSFRH